ncbi:hypothetical protein RAC89_31260 [Paenibacillus sp. GD4]|nr:hypothetical protein [Paenibacillus sp. GD4]MDQ1914866.1 hypothetical protein [Paenibacillus sp. GD4]
MKDMDDAPVTSQKFGQFQQHVCVIMMESSLIFQGGEQGASANITDLQA